MERVKLVGKWWKVNKLTPKQKRFVEEYVKSGNATQSYIDAGYKATSRDVAEANARKLLGNYSVVEYMRKLNAEIANRNIADMTEVKEFWSSVMRSNHYEIRDRLKASEYIAKTNGGFIDKVEANVENSGVLTVVFDPAMEDE